MNRRKLKNAINWLSRQLHIGRDDAVARLEDQDYGLTTSSPKARRTPMQVARLEVHAFDFDFGKYEDHESYIINGISAARKITDCLNNSVD